MCMWFVYDMGLIDIHGNEENSVWGMERMEVVIMRSE